MIDSAAACARGVQLTGASANRDLDPVAVGVEQVGRVVAGTVLRPLARAPVVGAAGPDPRLPGGLDRGDAGAREAHALAPRLRGAAGVDKEPRLLDPPPDPQPGVGVA